MVIKPPPYIYERDVPNPEDEDETEVIFKRIFGLLREIKKVTSFSKRT